MLVLPPVYPILDTVSLERHGIDPVLSAEALLEGGARILQFRHKGFWNRETFELAQRIARSCGAAGSQFVVNDRADYAAILGAGLHVGQDDLLPVSCRRVIGPGAMLGFSTHNPEQMTAARDEPVDYVAFGPIFSTLSKERPDPTVGPESLMAIRRLTARPLVAIGGITRENAAECWQCGADSVAVISDLLMPGATRQNLRQRMEEWISCGRISCG